MAEVKIIARPWQPQDLIDDLQELIDEESDNYLNTRRTTLCMARDYLEEYFATDNNVGGKWIPVTERLPKEWTDVLVWSKCGFCVVAVSLGSHGKWRESWTHMMLDSDSVTHWMPLPEPPKGE